MPATAKSSGWHNSPSLTDRMAPMPPARKAAKFHGSRSGPGRPANLPGITQKSLSMSSPYRGSAITSHSPKPLRKYRDEIQFTCCRNATRRNGLRQGEASVEQEDERLRRTAEGYIGLSGFCGL